eukprot:Ihof_evm17s121 gene=Ihof_evmTU17s121
MYQQQQPQHYGQPPAGTPYGQPSPRPQRHTQIMWMKNQFGKHLKESTPGMIFDLPIQSQASNTNAAFSCLIKITLPPAFPETQGPIIQVINPVPPVSHQWLDPNGYAANHPQIISWHPSYKLAQIVKDVATAVAESTRRSQSVQLPSLPGKPPSLPGSLTPPGTRVGGPGPMGFLPRTTTSPTATASPLASNYPELDRMSAKELEEFLEDEVKFTEYCIGLPSITNLTTLSKETKDNVEALARENLSKEAELEAACKRLALDHETLEMSRQRYEELVSKLQAMADRYQPSVVLEKLRAAATEQEKETE